jgi:hypothetical protein
VNGQKCPQFRHGKEESEISNTEVVEIIRLQVFDNLPVKWRNFSRRNATSLLQNTRNLFREVEFKIFI